MWNRSCAWPEEAQEELTELGLQMMTIYLKAEQPLKASQVQRRLTERGYQESGQAPGLAAVETTAAMLTGLGLLSLTARKGYYTAQRRR